jgi:predicted nucleotide-binding protein
MNSADMASLVPNPDDLLSRPVEEQGKLILKLLAAHDSSRNPVAHSNFFNRANDFANPPKYGSRQREVDEALMETWTWLENRGFLTRKPSSGGATWVFVGKAGKDFLIERREPMTDNVIRMQPRAFLSFIPTVDDILADDVIPRGHALLAYLKSYEGMPGNLIYQNGLISPQNLWAFLNDSTEFGDKRDKVIAALKLAWRWLETNQFLVPYLDQPARGYSISESGEALLRKIPFSAGRFNPGARMASAPGTSRKVFIVHGHDDGTREAVARFLEHSGFEPIILHEQASSGRTVIEKIEAHGDVSFAVVLLTPDDEGCKKGGTPQPRARQNVVLELGYFIARLGRNRVCALKVGDNLEIPSDFGGVVYVPFDSSGGWRQTLAKELEAAGFTIDWNKVMGRRS